MALDHFVGRIETVDLLHFDNATEYVAAAQQMKTRFDTRDANRPASKGGAERAVRRMLEGARTVLYDSGLPHCYWSEAVEAYCANRNFHDEIRNTKKTAHQLRFGHKFKGIKVPFGAAVRWLPAGERLSSARGKFDPRTRPGIFVGCKIASGGVGHGVYHVIDVNDYVNAESHHKVYIQETKELVLPK